jgi:hypothetical protein
MRHIFKLLIACSFHANCKTISSGNNLTFLLTFECFFLVGLFVCIISTSMWSLLTLSLSVIISKVSQHSHVWNFDVQIIIHTEFVGVCMIYFHTKFHILISNCTLVPLVTCIRRKAKHRIHTATKLLCIVKRSHINKNCILFRPNIKWDHHHWPLTRLHRTSCCSYWR